MSLATGKTSNRDNTQRGSYNPKSEDSKKELRIEKKRTLYSTGEMESSTAVTSQMAGGPRR